MKSVEYTAYPDSNLDYKVKKIFEYETQRYLLRKGIDREVKAFAGDPHRKLFLNKVIDAYSRTGDVQGLNEIAKLFPINLLNPSIVQAYTRMQNIDGIKRVIDQYKTNIAHLEQLSKYNYGRILAEMVDACVKLGYVEGIDNVVEIAEYFNLVNCDDKLVKAIVSAYGAIGDEERLEKFISYVEREFDDDFRFLVMTRPVFYIGIIEAYGKLGLSDKVCSVAEKVFFGESARDNKYSRYYIEEITRIPAAINDDAGEKLLQLISDRCDTTGDISAKLAYHAGRIEFYGKKSEYENIANIMRGVAAHLVEHYNGEGSRQVEHFLERVLRACAHMDRRDDLVAKLVEYVEESGSFSGKGGNVLKEIVRAYCIANANVDAELLSSIIEKLDDDFYYAANYNMLGEVAMAYARAKNLFLLKDLENKARLKGAGNSRWSLVFFDEKLVLAYAEFGATCEEEIERISKYYRQSPPNLRYEFLKSAVLAYEKVGRLGGVRDVFRDLRSSGDLHRTRLGATVLGILYGDKIPSLHKNRKDLERDAGYSGDFNDIPADVILKVVFSGNERYAYVLGELIREGRINEDILDNPLLKSKEVYRQIVQLGYRKKNSADIANEAFANEGVFGMRLMARALVFAWRDGGNDLYRLWNRIQASAGSNLNSMCVRLAKELTEENPDRGVNIIFKILQNPDIPDRLFIYLNLFLISKGKITDNLTEKFVAIEDSTYSYRPRQIIRRLLRGRENTKTGESEHVFLKTENIPFLKSLIRKYPEQYSTVIDTLAELRLPLEDKRVREDVFRALDGIGTVTPIIFRRYRETRSPKEREKLAENLRNTVKRFFKNGNLLKLAGGEYGILAELIYKAYRPRGMTLGDVKKFIKSGVRDRSQDIEKYIGENEGVYDFNVRKIKYVLREGEEPNNELQDKLMDMMGLIRKFGLLGEGKGRLVSRFEKVLKQIIKGTSDIGHEDVALLSGLLGGFPVGYNDLRNSPYSSYMRIKEYYGIYAKENLKYKLESVLHQLPELRAGLENILGKKGRVDNMKRIFRIGGDDLSLEHLIAEAIIHIFNNRIVRDINREIKKYEPVELEEEINRNIKLYISKNVGSFFAKAAVGICTSRDISLWNWENHFHMNIVEHHDENGESRVVGNIQAYIIEDPYDKEVKSLLLRGFNPASRLLESGVSPESFVESAFDVAERFANENNLKHIYITDQGAWYALTNREGILPALSKYMKNPIPKSYKVASDHTTPAIFRIR